jgi:hypothetical protein
LLLCHLFERGHDELNRDVKEKMSRSLHGLLIVAFLFDLLGYHQKFVLFESNVQFVVVCCDVAVESLKRFHNQLVLDGF